MTNTRWRILAGAAAVIIAVQTAVIVWLFDARKLPARVEVNAGRTHGSLPASKSPSAPSPAANEHRIVLPQTQSKRRNDLLITDRLAVLMDAKKKRMLFGVNVRTGEGKISNDFAEFFGLNPAEREHLQRTMDAAAVDVERLERDNATVRRESASQYVVEIRAFPEKGGEIYDRLIKEFEATLGSDRVPAFHSLAAESLERQLGRMGTSERKLTITWDPVTEFYDVRNEYKSAGESGSSTGRMASFSELEKYNPVISGLVPRDFPKKDDTK